MCKSCDQAMDNLPRQHSQRTKTKDEQVVTIAVAAYNVSQFIREAIQSALNQSYRNTEILVVNDGSEDDTPSICEELAETDGRIHVLHKPNEGLSSARNVAIKECSGDFITFLDGDDCLHPQFVEQLLGVAAATDAEVVHAKMTQNWPVDDLACRSAFWTASADEVLAMLASHDNRGYPIPNSCGKLLSRAVFSKILYPLGRIHEDEFVAHEVLLLANRIGFLDAPMYYHRANPSSITSLHGNAKSFRSDIFDAFESRLKRFEELNLTKLATLQRCSMAAHQLDVLNKLAGSHRVLPRAFEDTMKRYARRLIPHVFRCSSLRSMQKLALLIVGVSPRTYCKQQVARFAGGQQH